MQIRSLLFLSLMLIIAACQAAPEREIVVQETVVITQIVVVTATTPLEGGPLPIGSPDVNTTQTQAVPTQAATATPTVGPTATPDVFPKPIVGQIFVANQTFQNGEMFWLEPIEQIWVLTTDSEGIQRWIVQEDSFEEGLPENDPSLTPPATGLAQPIRGFGMLWRNDETLRDALGWATGEELGYLTNYEYHWGGTVNDAGEYVSGPGYHLVETLNRTIYRFDEATRTWEIIRQSE